VISGGEKYQASMVNWKVTITTVYCDEIDDEATLIVYKDKSARCATHRKYGQPDRETAKRLNEKSQRLSRQIKCEGPDCRRLREYRDKLFAKESD